MWDKCYLVGRKHEDEGSPTCKFWGQPEVYSKVINNQNSRQNQSDNKAGKEEVAKKEAHMYLMMKNYALRVRQRPPEKIPSNGKNEWQKEMHTYVSWFRQG